MAYVAGAFQAKLAPRELSPDQQRSMLEMLKKYNGKHIRFRSYPDDAEGFRLAVPISKVLMEAGIIAEYLAVFTPGSLLSGVRVRGPASEQDFVDAIKHALTLNGIEIAPPEPEFAAMPDVSNVEVFVGVKPIHP